jgi:hypothetical protein
MTVTNLSSCCVVFVSVLAPVKQCEPAVITTATYVFFCITTTTLARLVVYVCVVKAAPPVHKMRINISVRKKN